MPIPRHGRFINSNYLFFEGLAALREATLCGCAGLVHASFATLRSAFEMLSLHHWWRDRLFFAESHEGFYDWLEGRRKPPPLKNVLEENWRTFNPAPGMATLDQARDVYEFLCAYSHRPILKESTVRMRGGNASKSVPGELFEFWLDGLERTTRLLLENMVSARPECLFPVELHRKFGFNQPIGLFFDQHNFRALQSAFSVGEIASFCAHYNDHDTVVSLRDWLASQADISDEAVLESWEEEEIDDRERSLAERITARVLMQKAKVRAMAWGFAYGNDQMAQNLALPKIELPQW